MLRLVPCSRQASKVVIMRRHLKGATRKALFVNCWHCAELQANLVVDVNLCCRNVSEAVRL